MKIRENKGITLVTLVITIIVMLIIAGITVYSGKEIIKKARLEELKTNMLLIEAKAKEYVEEANFKIGKDSSKIADVREEIYEDICALSKASEENISSVGNINVTDGFYVVTTNTLKNWGLDKIELKDYEQYLIEFKDNINDNNQTISVEIYNTKGYDGKYSLTEIENIEE